MREEKHLFGKCGERDIYIYTLRSGDGYARVMNYGASIVSFSPFGKNIVGGFDSLEYYTESSTYQGATIGRVANRIADATLTIDGAIYMLTQNETSRNNCLHGGSCFSTKVWDITEASEDSVLFSYYSPDGEDGFPAGLFVTLRYTLKGGDLIIDYKAVAEGKTSIAMTNHAFFNLDTFEKDTLDHTLTIYADRVTESDERLLPTGRRLNVEGTPFDFKTPHKIGERLSEGFSGYDHNYILNPECFKTYSGKKLGLAAMAEAAGLKLSVYTDQPGLQFYSCEFLEGGRPFSGGIPKKKYGAFCLEAQIEPNAVNNGVGIYEAGEEYTQTTVYSVEKTN